MLTFADNKTRLSLFSGRTCRRGEYYLQGTTYGAFQSTAISKPFPFAMPPTTVSPALPFSYSSIPVVIGGKGLHLIREVRAQGYSVQVTSHMWSMWGWAMSKLEATWEGWMLVIRAPFDIYLD